MAEGHMATNENRLLSTLPAEDYRRIAPKLERVSLAARGNSQLTRKHVTSEMF